MTTMTAVEQSQGRVKALALRGVSPTADNVQQKAYLLTRDSFLVLKAAAAPAAQRFVDFARSAQGAQVIAANGAVPLK
jgi:ABC-type phosphate transport system substrate-binding protein